MAGRKKAEPKEAKKSLLEYNKGFKLRGIEVGQRIDVFKIPYKAQWSMYKAEVLKILRMGTLGAWCEVLRLDSRAKSIEFIYLGKIYEGRDKPF